MQLDLGQKIRELRRRDGRTQENLADALGVTSQAVSRWEANGGYPDMQMIPAIAIIGTAQNKVHIPKIYFKGTNRFICFSS